MSTTTITYGQDFLNIRIPTNAPAETHYLLMKGLVTSLKNPLLIKERNLDDVDSLVTLAKILGQVVPTERHLEKAY